MFFLSLEAHWGLIRPRGKRTFMIFKGESPVVFSDILNNTICHEYQKKNLLI